MLTAGEAITAALRLGTNLGSPQYKLDVTMRDHARMYLQQHCGRVFTLADHWWRQVTDSVTILANVGSGGMPTDFSNLGTEGHIYVLGHGRPIPMLWIRPDKFSEAEAALNGATATIPTHYTLHTTTNGIPILRILPVNAVDVELEIRNYNRRVPEMVDAPMAPVTAADAAAGNLNGTYESWRVTFVTFTGETEGGFPSEPSLTVVNKKVNLTEIPVSPARSVTGRKVYRPVAGGLIHKLAATIADNVSTTLQDDLADIGLGVTMPGNDVAQSGLEFFPGDFHETVILEGLIALLKRAQGDGQSPLYTKEWERMVKNMWWDQRQGRNFPKVMPRYGQPAGLGASLSRMRFRGI